MQFQVHGNVSASAGARDQTTMPHEWFGNPLQCARNTTDKRQQDSTVIVLNCPYLAYQGRRGGLQPPTPGTVTSTTYCKHQIMPMDCGSACASAVRLEYRQSRASSLGYWRKSQRGPTSESEVTSAEEIGANWGEKIEQFPR